MPPTSTYLTCLVAATAFGPSADAFPASHTVNILCCDVPSSVRPTLKRYEDEGMATIECISTDDEGLAQRLERGDADAVVIRSSNAISRDTLERLPKRVRAIGRAGVGCDNIDLDACSKANIPVVTASGANAVAVAEHTLALVLALARRIKPCIASIAEGRWERASLTGIGLRGKTLGIVGFGAIGSEVASICGAMGMRVLVAPPTRPLNDSKAIEQRSCRIKRASAIEAATLYDVLRTSDFVSVHLPLTRSSRNYIGEAEIDLMKSTAMLISTARGGVVDEAALLNSLKSGDIGGVALDVFESEGAQLASDPTLMELANMDSTIVTPHVGGHTAEAQADVWNLVMDRLIDKLKERG